MIADLEQRQLALEPGQSFAVSAPAGSGKTGLLTQRVLKLLAIVEQPEEILCLTFTRKAAAEMQHRIASSLAHAAITEAEPEDEYLAATWRLARAALQRDQQQGWQLLQSPNRLRITTIDGFFRNLAQQLATESGLGDLLEPLDNPRPHYEQVVSTFLLSQLQGNQLWTADVTTLLQHLDNDLNRVGDLLIGLLEKREQWLQHLLAARDARPYLEDFLQQTIAETLQEAEFQLQPIAYDLALLADYAANTLKANHKPSPTTACLGIDSLPSCQSDQVEQWLGLVHLLITTDPNKPSWRSDRGINIGLGFPTAKVDPEWGDIRKQQLRETLAWCREQNGLLELLVDVRNLPAAFYSESQWRVLNALTRLLPALAANLSIYFQQQGCIDFTEVTLAALRSLGDEEQPTDLAMKLDYQIHHILVDEFQDTSSIQFLILKNLTREWTPGDGRSLFVVGDGMQSLYGFRNANVGLFLEVRQQPIGNIHLQPLDLSVNFRSESGILDWVNEAFSNAFPAQENIGRGAVNYRRAEPFLPASNNHPVTIDVFMDQVDDGAEALQVVSLVKDALLERPEGNIAILVRNRSHLKVILKSLRTADISWQAADIDPLKNKMPVIDLMSLTRALLSPADRIAWLAILRAPWCGLDLNDLYFLANTRLASTLASPLKNGAELGPEKPEKYPLLLNQILRHNEIGEISHEGHQILDRVSEVLLNAWQNRDRQPLRHRVESSWLALGGPAALKLAVEHEYCQQYFDFLEQQSPVYDWTAFEQSLDKLYAVPNPAADPRVQVMTIHKAKGLEFDTVIIPGLDRAGRSGAGDLLLWRERIAEDGQPQLLIAPLQASGQDKSSLYRHLQHEAKIKEQLESTRVLYVGATRAIHQLHLLCKMKQGKAPANNSLLARLWPWLEGALGNDHSAIRLHEAPVMDISLDDGANTLPSFSHIWRLPADWRRPAAKHLVNLNESRNNKVAISEFDPKGIAARHIGTVLHRIIRQITLEGVDNWKPSNLKARAAGWRIQLRQLGVVYIEPAINTLVLAVENILADTNHHWLFDHQLTDSHCELALGYMDDNQLPRTAIIDRAFVYQGELWVVDYKSSQPAEDEPFEAFVANQRSQYSQQLNRYAELFASFTLQPEGSVVVDTGVSTVVKKALYFPLCQHLEMLD